MQSAIQSTIPEYLLNGGIASITRLNLSDAASVEQARFNMIEQQVRPWDVLDDQVLSLLHTLHREDFVPAMYRALAFADLEIPLEQELMFSPKVQARLVQDAQVQKTDEVLVIGAGSAYVVALLAALAHKVTALELNPEIAQLAQRNLHSCQVLQGLQSQAVQVIQGCGFAYAQTQVTQGQKWDVIVLCGGVEQIPPYLLDGLKIDGRLLAFVGKKPLWTAQTQVCTAPQQYKIYPSYETTVPSLQNAPRLPRFRF